MDFNKPICAHKTQLYRVALFDCIVLTSLVTVNHLIGFPLFLPLYIWMCQIVKITRLSDMIITRNNNVTLLLLYYLMEYEGHFAKLAQCNEKRTME